MPCQCLIAAALLRPCEPLGLDVHQPLHISVPCSKYVVVLAGTLADIEIPRKGLGCIALGFLQSYDMTWPSKHLRSRCPCVDLKSRVLPSSSCCIVRRFDLYEKTNLKAMSADYAKARYHDKRNEVAVVNVRVRSTAYCTSVEGSSEDSAKPLAPSPIGGWSLDCLVREPRLDFSSHHQ